MIHRIALAASGRIHKIGATALLGARDFGIVSNNCWGAHINQFARRRYNTPFVGLFLSPSSYLELLRGWPSSLHADLKFRSFSTEASVEKLRQSQVNPWTVGQLGNNIEVQFMHYQSERDARSAWYRRLARMPTDTSRIFFKFDDRDGATADDLDEFSSLPLVNKVLFVSERNNAPGRVVVPSVSGETPDGFELAKISSNYFDAAAWISGRKQRPGSWLSRV